MQLEFKYVNSMFSKCVIVVMVIVFIVWLMTRGSNQINRPRVVGVALPNSSCSIDQSSTQVQVTEKPFEVGIGVASGRYDNKDAYGALLFFRYKF